ncbi:LLM class flavin-dependent oxidoreductase [Nocardioides yefusunii]|uniref:LLM class flavin-dependent oxidoreductase n=1 Tax=Nocardioides yefusunii TaxID=2500546 RepID=A0ABW1QVP1_9ACTN|nr:LLM class flavin-dependent oxidoreductase [Nocardioides yefusunii]
MTLELGLDTFGDVPHGPDSTPLPHHQVIRQIVDQAVLAEEVGLDVFNVGEHHREDFAITAPDVVLAGIAGRTERITLGTAVTVLSSEDPIRVYERFATLDALSSGRAEVTLGRGSFTESFPLFGLDLDDYEILFEEKLELFSQLRTEQPVAFTGSHRRPLKSTQVYPQTERGTLPAWVGVGGSPESVVRAARHSLPMMLAVIGGSPSRFAPFVDLYHRALAEFHLPELPVGVHAPGFVAGTDDEAKDLLYPHFKASRDRIGAERGWGPMSRIQFEQEVSHGALFVGSPETVATKIASTVKELGLSRFDLKYTNGPQPHEELMECIRLYGTEVAPLVREMLQD